MSAWPRDAKPAPDRASSHDSPELSGQPRVAAALSLALATTAAAGRAACPRGPAGRHASLTRVRTRHASAQLRGPMPPAPNTPTPPP